MELTSFTSKTDHMSFYGPFSYSLCCFDTANWATLIIKSYQIAHMLVGALVMLILFFLDDQPFALHIGAKLRFTNFLDEVFVIF